MSQDVSLNVKDYANIIKWYELAFGKTNDTTPADRYTFTKQRAKAMAYTDEIKERLGKEEEDDK